MSSRMRHRPSATPARSNTVSAGPSLPPYEPPQHPLNQNALASLARLKNQHQLTKLREHYNQATACVTDSAAAINEVLQKRDEKVQRARERALQHGGQVTQAAQADARALAEMQDKVEQLTRTMEEAIRQIVDGQHYCTDMEKSVGNLALEVQMSQSQRTNGRRNVAENEELDDDEDFDPTLPGSGSSRGTQGPAASTAFRDGIAREREKYRRMNYLLRYAEHPDYVGFRRALHDAQFPSEDAPDLPNHSKWFNGNELAPGLTLREAKRIADGDREDEDLQVTRANFNTKCPLTLTEFVDPVTSKKCPHSFERAAIMDMISRSLTRVGGSNRRGARDGARAVECPCPGCSVYLTQADLHVDPTFIRRLQRVRQAREREGEGNEDSEDEGRPTQVVIHSDDLESLAGDRGRGFSVMSHARKSQIRRDIAAAASPSPDITIMGADEDDEE